MTQQKKGKRRLHLIDTVRGLALLSMIIYHGCYDAVAFFQADWPWYRGLAALLWQQSILWTFVLVSGASCHFSSNSLRRGLIVFAAGVLITLVSYLATPSAVIYFGVLHMLGLAMILCCLGRPFWRHIPPLAGFAVFFLLFLFTYGLPNGYLGLLSWQFIPLDPFFYRGDFLFWLGLPTPNFYSADYVPLIPWFFLYMTGYYGWELAKNRHFLRRFGAWRLPLVSWLGRNSLFVYLLHQPLLLGICYLLSLFN